MSYRILCIGQTWIGSDSMAAFRALVRLGHSIHVLDEWHFVPSVWSSLSARAIRKVCRPLFVGELERRACRAMDVFRPHLLFVFKGNCVHPRIVASARERGIPAVNYYPDVSMIAHGPYIPKTIPLYDQVFTTKSYGLEDMRRLFGQTRSTFLEPGFDPEIHRQVALSREDRERYGCDVTFIGTWSPKKERLLSVLKDVRPDTRLKIWGCQWDKAGTSGLTDSIMGEEVTGYEYAKAIQGASICLGLLSEKRHGASSGDLITARTFQIPACATLMLHERNDEAERYFEEGRDVSFFTNQEELVAQVHRYLVDAEARKRIARAGFERSRRDGYSIDAKMERVLRWVRAFRRETSEQGE